MSKTSRDEATRPPCAVCGGVIPKAALSDKDVASERAYSRERHGKMRDFYCSRSCFGVARDSECGSGTTKRGGKREGSGRRNGSQEPLFEKSGQGQG